MAAPKEIKDLVERFESNISSYKSGHYNETQVRREFVDPFFKALGWDIDNEQGFAEAYKDVIHEDAIRVGATTRAPDYSFRVGGLRKFFLETKKPSVDIKTDIHPAFQLRRYAWTAKLPLSILTDFEELSVYDCRIKPDKADKPTQARIMYLTYQDYLNRWDEIAGIFSKEAILKGSFDKFAEDKKSKRGTAEVDTAFLEEIASWRDILARNIAIRNPDLSTKDLNYAVQATVNRIVFLRICEDRGIERHMKLQDLLNGERVYPRLCELFHRADERYNSGLFHFEKEAGRESPDNLTLNLDLDDKPLKDIIKRLYYPDSPYEFSVLPAEILGQVYEQFLGKVIRLTTGHRAVVEDKPEVKKAGGVKYTPVYIVDYIVKTTLGPTLKGKTWQDVALIRVLDPACGSGSFLIVAYQYLLDWHRDWYLENLVPLLERGLKPTSAEVKRLIPGAQDNNNKDSKGKKGKKRDIELPIYQGRGGEWRLTTAERKRILLNNIYGVDIDSQAVEVTKLSLLLKVLEGENEETLDKQLKLFQERALPDLGNNIKCGNSLIGLDILQEKPDLAGDELERINPFDWNREFPEVFQNGGFSVVIGNPPYIRIQTMKEWAPLEVEYYKQKYASAIKGNYDIYVVFVERGLSFLNKNGRLGFILPHKFFNAKYGQPLRELIAKGKNLSEIVHFGDQQVFAGATTYTCLMFLEKRELSEFSFLKVDDLIKWRSQGLAAKGSVLADSIGSSEWNFSIGEGATLFDRLNKFPTKLRDIGRIFQGLVTGADKIFVLEDANGAEGDLIKVKDQDGLEWLLEHEILKPFLNDVTVSTFENPHAHHWLIFPYQLHDAKAKLISKEEMISAYPRAYQYLNSKSEILRKREGGKWNNDHWYAFSRNQNMSQMGSPKLIVQVISQWGKYAYDSSGIYFSGGGNGPYYGIRWADKDNQHNLHYLQALLSSCLLDYYLRQISSPFRGGYWSYGKRFIEQLPIRTINFSDPQDVARHDRMVSLVEQMLTLNKQLQEARTPHEKTTLQRQIEATDRQIDNLVYELYGLTEEEIRIVEGNN